MKKKSKELYEKFKLPKYIKGKSFAEASKAIEAKFDGLNDKAAIDTKQALMKRLADMQEYVKAQQAPPEQYVNPMQQMQQNPMQQNQAFLGGMFGGKEGASFMDASGQANKDAGGNAYLQGAGTLFKAGNDMFGKTGVDTSGRQGNMEKFDTAGNTVGSTLQGAAAGAQIAGPLGAAIGGGVGLVGGLVGGNRKNDDIKKANQKFDIAGVNSKINSFALGGMTGPGGKKKKKGEDEDEVRNKVDQKALNTLNNSSDVKFDMETANRLFYLPGQKNAKNIPDLNLGKYSDVNYFDVQKQGENYLINPTNVNPQNAQGYKSQLNELQQLNPNAKFADQGYVDFSNRKAMGGYQNKYVGGGFVSNPMNNDEMRKAIRSVGVNNGANGFTVGNAQMGIPGEVPGYKLLTEPNQQAVNAFAPKLNNQEAANQSKQNVVGVIGNNNANNKSTSISNNNDKKTNSNYLENAMRYAPSIMNAFQLANMEKPEVESRQMNNRKFDPALIDESRIQRDIMANQGNTARSLQNIANGSKGFVASNMLGSDLNTSKAIGNAAVNAQAQNNSQTQFGQQFDNQNEMFNIQQDNLQQDLTDRNKGVYDTNKSTLLSQIGTDIGNIGKEQLFKKYPEMMGMSYDANGNYVIKMKDGKTFKLDKDGKPLEENTESKDTNESSMGGYQSSYNSHMNSLMKANKNK